MNKTLTLIITLLALFIPLIFYPLVKELSIFTNFIPITSGMSITDFYCLIKNNSLIINNTLYLKLLIIMFLTMLFIIYFTRTKYKNIILGLDPWIILIMIIIMSYKYPIGSINHNIMISSLLTGYIMTCGYMFIACYRDERFSVFHIFVWFFRVFIIVFTVKHLIDIHFFRDIFTALYLLNNILFSIKLNNICFDTKLYMGPDSNINYFMNGPGGVDLDNPTDESRGWGPNNMSITPTEWQRVIDRLKTSAIALYNDKVDKRAPTSTNVREAMTHMQASDKETYFITRYFKSKGYLGVLWRNVTIYGRIVDNNIINEMKSTPPSDFANKNSIIR